MSDAPAQSKLDEVGEEEIFALVADGETIGTLGRRWGVSRRTFYNWINAGGKERRAKLEAAKREAAEALVEKADTILDSANPVTIAVAKEQAKHLVWKAGKLDRDTWGEKPANLNLNVDIGSLHLDALRQVGSMSKVPALPAVAMVLESDDTDQDAQSAPAR